MDDRAIMLLAVSNECTLLELLYMVYIYSCPTYLDLSDTE